MSGISQHHGAQAHTLYLLRHSIVVSHRGDVPITDAGREIARATGRRLAGVHKRMRLLYGSTLRARQTAEEIGAGATEAGAGVLSIKEAFALRNPDIYVAGVRVNLVSSYEAVAEQVAGLSVDEAARVPFFQGFLGANDRVGWWLEQSNPPGENSRDVAKRIAVFAGSFADNSNDDAAIIAVTHSPVLRACAIDALGRDTGEPDWVAGLRMAINPDRTVRMTMLDTAP